MAHKLLVITAGTVAASVGQTILKQMRDYPRSELIVMVRSIDTAFLPDRYPSLRPGEWFQISIDPRYMQALYQNISDFPRLQKMLYPGLLPETETAGGGGIRYNGAGAVEVKRGDLRRWLSDCMADLASAGDRSANISIALIVSAVGATGSGAAEHLIDIIIDAAHIANVQTANRGMIHCDTFILQPPHNVTDLELANTLALYVEMAASELSQRTTRSYSGRKIMIGWGSTYRLSSIEQLKEVAATIVRLSSDPIYGFLEEFGEREVDNHVLRELDPLTHLPMHLSLLTAVSINFGRLIRQVVQRDVSRFIDSLVFDPTPSSNQGKPLLGRFADPLAGVRAEGRYQKLLDYLAAPIDVNEMKRQIDNIVTSKDLSAGQKNQRLINLWRDYKEEIRQSSRSIQAFGETFLTNASRELERSKEGYICEADISLAALRDEYRSLQADLAATIRFVQENTHAIVGDAFVIRQQQGSWPFRLLQRRAKLRRLSMAIKDNLQEHLREVAKPIAIDILDKLEQQCADIRHDLEVALSKLRRQFTSEQHPALPDTGVDVENPLDIAGLSSPEEMAPYADQISLFSSVQGGNGLTSFRTWLRNQPELEALFKGNLDILLTGITDYTRQRVQAAVEKYSIIDVLQHTDYGILRQRLIEAAIRATPLVSYSEDFAPYRHQIWYVCAYFKDENEREALQKAISEVFPQGQCRLLLSGNPTEIAVFYHVDGLPMSAIKDLQGRCLRAFLERQQIWRQQRALLSEDHPVISIRNLNWRIGAPVFSSREAELLVEETGVIRHLYAIRDIESEYAAREQTDASEELETGEELEAEATRLSLFAIAHAAIEEDDRAFVDKVYTVQAGVSQSKPEDFVGEPFDLPASSIAEPLSFNILLHASENIQLTADWQKPLLYSPSNQEPQMVEFTFRVIAPGHSSLDISFYYERRWLRTIHFEFDAVEQSQAATSVAEG